MLLSDCLRRVHLFFDGILQLWNPRSMQHCESFLLHKAATPWKAATPCQAYAYSAGDC